MKVDMKNVLQCLRLATELSDCVNDMLSKRACDYKPCEVAFEFLPNSKRIKCYILNRDSMYGYMHAPNISITYTFADSFMSTLVSVGIKNYIFNDSAELMVHKVDLCTTREVSTFEEAERFIDEACNNDAIKLGLLGVCSTFEMLDLLENLEQMHGCSNYPADSPNPVVSSN